LTLAVAFGAGFRVAQVASFPGLPLMARHNPHVKMDAFWQAWQLIEQDFIGTIPTPQKRVYGAIRGLLVTLDDKYTVFVEPQHHRREKEDLQGRFGGIGVTLQRNEAGDPVLTPLPDSPAIRTGVLSGDMLLTVDQQPITPTMSFEDIAALVRGQVGTQVTITVRRGNTGAPLSLTIVRQVINTPSVAYRILDQSPQIGYLAINRFTERSGEEVRSAAQELRDKGARYLILDLRDNGGGLLTAAVDVSSQFMSDKVVLYQQQKGQAERVFRAKPGGVAVDVPLLVLVNGASASASEIVAGALRDNERAVLIGERTYGKGSVQHIYDLGDGSSLHVTAAEWFTPNHRQLTGNGLEPDIVVKRSNEEVIAGRDPPLERAVAYWQNN